MTGRVTRSILSRSQSDTTSEYFAKAAASAPSKQKRHMKIQYQLDTETEREITKSKGSEGFDLAKVKSEPIATTTAGATTRYPNRQPSEFFSRSDIPETAAGVKLEKLSDGETANIEKEILSAGCMNNDGNDAGNAGKGWEPASWREQLENIREMRKNKDAPVDTMGCTKICDRDAPPQVNRCTSSSSFTFFFTFSFTSAFSFTCTFVYFYLILPCTFTFTLTFYLFLLLYI